MANPKLCMCSAANGLDALLISRHLELVEHQMVQSTGFGWQSLEQCFFSHLIKLEKSQPLSIEYLSFQQCVGCIDRSQGLQ